MDDLPESSSEYVKEILDYRFKNHHAYVNRQWQYYASFILLNGLVISGINNQDNLFRSGLAAASVFTAVVFFHLILWTSVRIQRNAYKIEKITQVRVIQAYGLIHPKGITLWLIGSITVISLTWFAWLISFDANLALLTFAIAIILGVISVRSCTSVLYETELSGGQISIKTLSANDETNDIQMPSKPLSPDHNMGDDSAKSDASNWKPEDEIGSLNFSSTTVDSFRSILGSYPFQNLGIFLVSFVFFMLWDSGRVIGNSNIALDLLFGFIIVFGTVFILEIARTAFQRSNKKATGRSNDLSED